MKIIPRPTRNEVFPTEPPGLYQHALGRDCWCRPVILGAVIIHRPWAECGREVAETLLASDVFPCNWNANRA